MADATPRPTMTLGGEFDDGYGEFLGVIVTDAWEHDDKRDAWKWHLAVKPLDITIKGETGAFHTWAKVSAKSNSVMGVQRMAMMEVFPADLELGEGKLIGVGAWFARKTIPFGVNRETGEEMKAEGVLIPLRLADDKENERIAQHGGTGVTPTVAPAATVESKDLDGDDLEAVLAFVSGKTAAEIQKAAASRSCELPREIKQGLISGALLAWLVQEGTLTMDDGVYVEAVAF